MTQRPNLAIIGAGLMGRRHVEFVKSEANLAALVDPSETAQAYASDIGVSWFADVDSCISGSDINGAIIATPNNLHVEQGLACLDAAIPVLIEKPLADTSEGAKHLVEAEKQTGVPVLVGHHRRHNPLIKKAKEMISSGQIGRLVAVNAQFWLYKPDDYFSAQWRRNPGAGPVFINLIHDVDLLRHLCGNVASVQALQSSAIRGFEVEDTAGAVIGFQNGAIGTISISDTAVAPWSWEFTSGENPAYPHVQTHAYSIAGNEGSITLPDLNLWRQPDKKGWWEPIESEKLTFDGGDPFALQIRHFVEVIEGKAEPLVNAAEGLESLRVTEAIKAAAVSGERVFL